MSEMQQGMTDGGVTIDMIASPAVMSTTIAHERSFAVLSQWLGIGDRTIVAGSLRDGTEFEIVAEIREAESWWFGAYAGFAVLLKCDDGMWDAMTCLTLAQCWECVAQANRSSLV